MRRPCPISQSGITVLAVAPVPFVERLAGNPEMPAGARHIPGSGGGLEYFQAPIGQPPLL
jgi:hypothetical protein